jgi:glycosyltransferase involved in cell wall biosynthesis
MLVTNDLIYDQRVLRHAEYLENNKRDVILVGRHKLNTNKEIPINFSHKRFNMIFNNSWLFYAEMNIRLTLFLLFKKMDIIWANDLDTLPAAFLISKLKRKALVYDSHEFFTGVPELENKPVIKNIWKIIESMLLRRIKVKFTVSDGIASLYRKHYNVEFDVIRNLSLPISKEKIAHLNLPEINGFSFSEPFLIYQGALNKDRGLECLINAMRFINGYKLLIVGGGDVESELHNLVQKKQLSNKVKFTGLIEPATLKLITPKAKVGFSIELPSNDNYRYCLPNKLFDYLESGIPTIAYENLEIKKLFNLYPIGLLIQSHDPKELADKVLNLLNNSAQMALLQEQIIAAKEEFCWKKESEKLGKLISVLETN